MVQYNGGEKSISVYFLNTSGNIDMKLCDSLGNQLKISNTKNDNESIVYNTTKSDDYKIHIYQTAPYQQYQDYVLTISIENIPEETTTDDDDDDIETEEIVIESDNTLFLIIIAIETALLLLSLSYIGYGKWKEHLEEKRDITF